MTMYRNSFEGESNGVTIEYGEDSITVSNPGQFVPEPQPGEFTLYVWPKDPDAVFYADFDCSPDLPPNLIRMGRTDDGRAFWTFRVGGP